MGMGSGVVSLFQGEKWWSARQNRLTGGRSVLAVRLQDGPGVRRKGTRLRHPFWSPYNRPAGLSARGSPTRQCHKDPASHKDAPRGSPTASACSLHCNMGKLPHGPRAA